MVMHGGTGQCLEALCGWWWCRRHATEYGVAMKPVVVMAVELLVVLVS